MDGKHPENVNEETATESSEIEAFLPEIERSTNEEPLLDQTIHSANMNSFVDVEAATGGMSFDPENSDTASFDSESMLIPKVENTDSNTFHVDNHLYLKDETKEALKPLTITEITYLQPMPTLPENECAPAYLGFSSTSIFEDVGTVVEEVKVIPLNIIGSGWEFGSMSSIHRRPFDVMTLRSRTNSMESMAVSVRSKRDGTLENRLLSRVFANQIGSIEIHKKHIDGAGLNKSFLTLSDNEKQEPVCEPQDEKRGSNFKNLMAVSLGMMLLHIAYYGLRNLLSSLNTEGGIGVISLAIGCGTFVIGSLISPFIILRFGPKMCLVMGTIAHIFYIIANYQATWLTIIPTSAVMGFGGAVLWNSISTYITETGMYESKTTNTESSHILSRYYGIFFLSLQLATVIGNLISSIILLPDTPNSLQLPPNVSINGQNNYSGDVYSSIQNVTEHKNISSNSQRGCGIGFCNDDELVGKQDEVDYLDKLFLFAAFTAFSVIAVIVLHFCLDHLPNFTTRQPTAREIGSQALSVLSMLFDKQFILVVPMCLYSFMSNGFVIADLLKAYITCPLGIYMVGYTMICFGLCGSISSYVFGKLVQYIGRIPVFLMDINDDVITARARSSDFQFC